MSASIAEMNEAYRRGVPQADCGCGPDIPNLGHLDTCPKNGPHDPVCRVCRTPWPCQHAKPVEITMTLPLGAVIR